jgi:Transposase DDE domain group 1
LLKSRRSTQKDTRLVKATARLGTVEVTADGVGLVSHAGAGLLVELADRAGLTDALWDALAATRERRSAHDAGRVLRDVAVMLADGGDCVTPANRRRTPASGRTRAPEFGRPRRPGWTTSESADR